MLMALRIISSIMSTGMVVASEILSKETSLLFFGSVKISSVKAVILILSSSVLEWALRVAFFALDFWVYVGGELGLKFLCVAVESLYVSVVVGFHEGD